MVNSTSAAIMNLYQGGMKHIILRENIEGNETKILFPKIVSVHNTGENESPEWKSGINIAIHLPETWLISILRVLHAICCSGHSLCIFLNTVYHGKQNVYHLLKNIFTCSKRQTEMCQTTGTFLVSHIGVCLVVCAWKEKTQEHVVDLTHIHRWVFSSFWQSVRKQHPGVIYHMC